MDSSDGLRTPKTPGGTLISGDGDDSPSNVFESVLNELKGIFVTKALQQANANNAFDARIIELESLLAFKTKEVTEVRSTLESQMSEFKGALGDLSEVACLRNWLTHS